MKILQVNVAFRRGSTGKLVADLHDEYKKKRWKSIICYSGGYKPAPPEPDVYRMSCRPYSLYCHFLARCTGSQYDGCFWSTNRLLRRIKIENPDVVHLHCINGYFVNIYRLLEFLKRNEIRTVVTLHAEFMYTGGCAHALECEKWLSSPGCGACPHLKKEFHSYFFDRTAYMWRRMVEAFDGFDPDKLIITSVSPWLMERAKGSFALRNYRHVVVGNAVNTNVFKRDPQNVRQELGIAGDEPIIFHAAPSFSTEPGSFKGGWAFAELAKRWKNKDKPGWFIVAGRYIPSSVNVPDNTTLLGNVDDQRRLAALYSAADATVITSKKETFSMVTAESLCCGTPVVGFKAGGPETITIPQYSRFVDYGNVDMLEAALADILTKRDLVRMQIAKEGAAAYSVVAMRDGYIDVYRSLK